MGVIYIKIIKLKIIILIRYSLLRIKKTETAKIIRPTINSILFAVSVDNICIILNPDLLRMR
jgi:hypothetical protein